MNKSIQWMIGWVGALIFFNVFNLTYAENPYTPPPGSPERKAIMDALREGLKRFPASYSLDFQYRKEDVGPFSDIRVVFLVDDLRIKDDWAWAEVRGKDYPLDLYALFHKKEGKWQVLGMVHPAYAACYEAYKECMDIKNYIYIKVREKFPSVPPEIFPEINIERKDILMTLSRMHESLPNITFNVHYLKIKDSWAWIETDPRSADGRSQYEPIDALLHKEKGEWKIKDVRPCCGECEEDPYCAKGIYHQKLGRMFPSAPKEIFPNKVRAR